MNSRLAGDYDSWSGLLRRHRNELGLLAAMLLVIGFTVWKAPSYSERPIENTQDVLRKSAMLGIFALGAATVILSGGIDLSSGSVIAFSGTIFTGILVLLAPKSPSGLPVTSDFGPHLIALATAVTLFLAFLVGTFHAWLITAIELPPFVATLASLVGLRSLAKLLVQNITEISHRQPKSTITINDELLLAVGQDGWWVPVVIWLVLAAALWVLLSRTVVGRHLYAMGGNEQAARLSGIRTDRLKWLAYCLGSVTAAIAGILYTCYIGTADPSRDGMGYELNAIASAVVGGCSLTGGIGTVGGVMLGALFLRVVIDSVEKTFKSRPDLFEGLVVGVLVVLAVAFNELRASRTGGLRKQFFVGVLGWFNVLILALLAGVITFVTWQEDKPRNSLIAAGATLLVLGGRAILEWRQDRRLHGS